MHAGKKICDRINVSIYVQVVPRKLKAVRNWILFALHMSNKQEIKCMEFIVHTQDIFLSPENDPTLYASNRKKYLMLRQCL